MQYVLIMCRSLTYAQRAERALERAGIASSVVKAPQEAAGAGCSYGVRVPDSRLAEAVATLQKNSISYGKIYRYTAGGQLQEVRG